MATAKKKASKKEGEEGSANRRAHAPAKRRPRKSALTKSKRVAKKTGKAKKAAKKKAPKKASCEESREEGGARKPRKKSSASREEISEEAGGEDARRRAETGKRSPQRRRQRRRARRLPRRARSRSAGRARAGATARNTYYITTAIAYPNGMPHIGHAYEAIATDALARFQRLDGKDVFFLTGTDEHGQKMIQTAQAEGMTPPELADRNAGRFKEMDERLNVSFDRFIRTTEPAHHRSRARRSGMRMQQNGDIYLDTYAGWYSVRDEAYYAEDETVVGEDNVRRGPQGTPVEWVEEKSYFFKLSAYQDRLLELYESQPDFIGRGFAPQRSHRASSRGGLKDLSISRTTFDWGIKVPDDPDHVMYVWVDALTNYITGVGFPDESDAELALLAGRSAHHRQGHHPLPCRVLAGIPDVGRHCRAEARLMPRLPVQQGREDVEVGRQCRRPLQSRRRNTASIRCAISSCARCRSGRTATTTTKPSSRASMPISPTISAIWRSARCR